MIFFHYGSVVDDLEAAMQELSDALGITWRPITRSDRMELHTPDGVEHWTVRRVYSLDGPPYIELVDDISGLSRDGGPPGRNHIGYWSDDIAADGARLEAAGCTLVLTDPSSHAWAVYRSPAGIFLELIIASARDFVLAAE